MVIIALVTTSRFHPSLIFLYKAHAYQCGAPYDTLHYATRAPVWYTRELHTNIRLGWKWIAGTNALTYHTAALNTAVSCFEVQSPSARILFYCNDYNRGKISCCVFLYHALLL
jgi:hypothetical protein